MLLIPFMTYTMIIGISGKALPSGTLPFNTKSLPKKLTA